MYFVKVVQNKKDISIPVVYACDKDNWVSGTCKKTQNNKCYLACNELLSSSDKQQKKHPTKRTSRINRKENK